MGFATPAAWLGLLLLALPLAVHMLVRDRARERPLATLRFLDGARPVAVRRSRPDEPALLALRLAVLALAVVALARPFLAPPEAGDDGGLVGGAVAAAGAVQTRVILVDASASMRRTGGGGADGETASERTHRQAAAEAEGATLSRTVTFGDALPLDAALMGAARWIESRPAPREIVVISDFPPTLPLPAGAAPAGVTVRAVAVEAGGAVPAPPGTAPVEARLDEAEAGGAAVRAEWRHVAPADSVVARLATALHPAEGAAEVVGALAAAGAPLPAAPLPVALRFAGQPPAAAGADGDAGSGGAQSGTGAGALLRLLRGDRVLAAAASVSEAAGGPAAPATGAVLARSGEGAPLVTAVAGAEGGVALEVGGAPESVLTAALLTALGRALPPDAAAGAELDPRTTGGEAVERWAQSSAGAAPADDPAAGGPSPAAPSAPARAAWLLALLLLAAEYLLRRRVHARRA